MNTKRTCVSCGMPLDGQAKRDFCDHCTGPDGQLKSYAEILTAMTEYMAQSMALSRTEAQKQAAAAMSQLPAWKGNSGGTGDD